MDFFDIKRRSVHFIVKSALGRFLKDIDRNHIEGVVMGKAGMQFELVNMELNETIFNEEILVDSPLRLVSGSVNSIRGTLGVFSNETRDLTIEGVDLTFDVIGNNKAREANTGVDGLTGGGGGGTRQPSNNTTSGGECGSFHSVASGPISRDEFRSEILGVQEVDDEQVSMGVSALSEAIKSLVHSITFTAEHVNVRLRFPPPNAEIVFGESPPEGSVELLLSLPNRVTLSDVVNRTPGTTHGNSFHKEIRFSGLRVALYDVATRSTQDQVTKDGEDVQHVKHSSIIFGGPVETVENVLTLKFIDVLPGRDARWEVGLHLTELRSVISPTQLSRLGVVMNALLGAPDADDDAGSSKKSLPEESTDRFSLSCTAMSLALLQVDNDAEVGICWKADEGKAGSLSTPHYAVSVSRGAFQVLSSTPTTSPKDDPYHSLFDRFPGRCYSIALANFSVVEKRPGPQYAPQTLLTFKNNSGGETSSSSKSLVCVVRTTCPMSVDSAKDVGVRIPQGHDFGLPVSRMDVAAQLIADLELTVDVDILDRVVKFAAQVGQLFQAKQQLGTQQHRSNTGGEEDDGDMFDDNGGDSPFDDFGSVVSGTTGFQKIPSAISLDDDVIRPSLPSTRSHAVPVSGVSSTAGGGGVPAFHHDPYTYYDNDEGDRKEYLTLSSISLKAKQLTFHVKFPSAKKPDPDLYGPLTQQLFASLVTAMKANGVPMDSESEMGDTDGTSIFGEGLGGRSVVSSASRWTAPTVRRGGGGPGVPAMVDSHHLKKALLIEIRDLLVDLPDGSSSVVKVDGTSAAVYLFDLPTMVRGEPILELLLRPQRNANPAAALSNNTDIRSSPHFCKVLLRPEVSAQTATTLVMHPELVKGPTLPPSKIAFNSASESDVLSKQRDVTAGADIDVTINIDRVTGRLHQDDLLLIMFMVDEVLGCVSKASRRLDRVISQQDALAVADEDNLGDSCRTVPESAVAMNLSVRDVKVVLWVPRLCANGKPAGQPLFMTLPAESQRNSATQFCLYHKYKIGANKLDVFLYSFTHSWLTGVTGAAENRPKTDSLINVSASFVMLAEGLPPKAPSLFVPPATTPGCSSTPKWKTTVPLLTSYASVYNYIAGGDGPTSKARPLGVFVRRLVDLEQLQVDTTVDVVMDRISVPHQVAHIGDHWLLALLAFVGDAPVASPGSPNVSPQRGAATATSTDDEDDSDGGESVDSILSNEIYTQPMTTVTRVTVNATKTLVDYQPFGYGCRIAAVIPVLRVETGDLFGHRPDARIKVFLQAAGRSSSCDLANILFHHNFSSQLVNAESPKAGSLGSSSGVAHTTIINPASNVSRNDIIMDDLRSLGFVQMLSLSSLGKGATIVLDIGGPDMPTKVQVRKLCGGFTCAKDSFQYFQIALSHYLGGLDASFLPTPQMFVKEVAKGRHIIQANLPAEPAAHQQFSVQMHIVEEEFEDRIRQCVRSEFFPNVRDDFTVTSNEDVFTELYAAPVTIPPSPQFDEDEGFDVIGEEEGSGLHPQWSWSKTVESLATYSGDGPSLASNMGLRLTDGGLMPARRHPPPPSSSQQQEKDDFVDITLPIEDVTRFCLADFETKGHFAPKADALDAAFTRGFSLIGCPPVEVEVMLLRCEGTVKLYAGLDFTEQGSRRGKSISYVSFSHMSSGFDSEKKKEPIEAICATITGINAQIDLFREGFDLGMRAYVEVKDIEIEDRIAESEVRTLFMAAVPKQFRDPSSSMLELQWTTILPCSMLGMSSLQSSEEQLSLRLEPFVLSLHRRAIDMLIEFTADEEEQWKRLNIEVPPSTMYFNRLFIHPVVATVNVLFEVRDLSKALHGEVAELCHLLPTLEGSKVQLNEIDIRSCHINNLGERIVELLSTRMLTMNAIFLLLCGVQPVRAATEMGKASIGLLIQPLDHYKRNRSVYAGILRGVKAFSRVSAAELLKMGAGATRTAHNVTNMSTGKYSRALVRGSQPVGLKDGVMRATREMQMGVEGVIQVMQNGGIEDTWRIPPIITDGFLKAFTEVLQGLRNNVSPSDMDRDVKLYKSHSKRAK